MLHGDADCRNEAKDERAIDGDNDDRQSAREQCSALKKLLETTGEFGVELELPAIDEVRGDDEQVDEQIDRSECEDQEVGGGALQLSAVNVQSETVAERAEHCEPPEQYCESNQ